MTDAFDTKTNPLIAAVFCGAMLSFGQGTSGVTFLDMNPTPPGVSTFMVGDQPQRSLSDRYRDMVQADWFREAYEGRSWGEGIAVETA